jgi:nicotinamidase-related amidase
MKKALLVIDVQNEYFTGILPSTYPPNCLANILRAMDEARAKGVPIVVVQHTDLGKDAPGYIKGTPGWQLHPDVAKRQYEHLVEKHLPGSFTGTDLESWLRQNGVDTLTIAGYMTHICCDTTARQALHLGFTVEFLSDGNGTLAISNAGGAAKDEELQRAVLVAQAMLSSKVMTTSDWINKL